MLYLSMLGQTISMARNQPHIATFKAADQDGADVSLENVTSAYLIISLSQFNDQPWPWGGVLPSIVKRYDTGFTLGLPEITFEFTQLLLSQLPLGTFIFEFGVSEDDLVYIPVQQGQITLAPSLWSPVG